MNLSQLKYVKAVAETGSFSRASEQCFVTQPSLSNAIAQLEEELGGRFFFRTTHNVSITPFGERMLPLVSAVLEAQSDLEKTAKNLVEPEQKLIRIGFCPSVNTSLLSSVLEPFKNAKKDIEIVLKECFLDELKVRLATDKIDVLFVTKGFEMKQIGKAEFYTEDLYYLPNNNAETLPQTVTIKEIADDSFTIAGEGCGLVYTLRDMFRVSGCDFREYAGQAMSYSVLEDWAKLGIGATILPKSKISKGNKSARQLLNDDKKAATITFEMVWSKQTPQGLHIKEFLRYFKKTVPEFIKGLAVN